jgi:DHA1 family inner membrane transport protein
VGTDAFVIAGLLPPIAESLQVSIGQAGQLVTVFALAYAISAPLVGALAAGWPLRTAVLTALLVLGAGNAITALAPSYAVVLASRVVAAVGAALYTASATSSAAALAGPARRGRAIAIVMAGTTSSLVLGTPLGTAVGAALGWRATLWLVAGLSAVASLVIVLRLPLLRREAAAVGSRFAPLADGRVRAMLACTFIAFLGIYMPYTYFSAVYAPSTGGSGARLAGLLLVFGVAGTAGNLFAGALADRFGPRRVVVSVTVALAVVFTALPVLQGPLPVAVGVAAVSGVLSFGVTAPQQQLVIALAPGAGSVITSLYQSAAYLAVSASGAVGAVAVDGWGGGAVGPLAAVFVLAAAALTAMGGRRRLDR